MWVPVINFVQIPRVYYTNNEPQFSYECWVMIICQYGFTNYGEYPILEGDTDNGKAQPGWGQEVYGKSLPSSQFYYEPD